MADERRDRGVVAYPPRLQACRSTRRACSARASACAPLSCATGWPRTPSTTVLATEEAMANAVQHSGSSLGLNVTLLFEGPDLVVEVRDHGKGSDARRAICRSRPDRCSPEAGASTSSSA